jgi:hypothetical protein
MAVEDIAGRPTEFDSPDRYRDRRRLASSRAASIWLSAPFMGAQATGPVRRPVRGPNKSKQNQIPPNKSKQNFLVLFGFIRQNRDFSMGYSESN